MKSGIYAKACRSVKVQQVFPQSVLQYEYVNRELEFKDLDFRLFVAGELEIIKTCGLDRVEKDGRLTLLLQLVYYNGIYEWSALLSLYAALLRKIELRQASWKTVESDIKNLEVPILARSVKKGNFSSSNSGPREKTSFRPVRSDQVWYCNEFNRGNCSQSDGHSGEMYGQKIKLQHICARCWRDDKAKRYHQHGSKACPKVEEN